MMKYFPLLLASIDIRFADLIRTNVYINNLLCDGLENLGPLIFPKKKNWAILCSSIDLEPSPDSKRLLVPVRLSHVDQRKELSFEPLTK